MTTLAQQIEQMHSRVDEIARNDERLVTTLANALTRADEKLLNDVVELTEEHEARRETILKELQALACRLGVFPRQPEQFARKEGAPRELEARQTFPLNLSVRARGDWGDELLLDDAINTHLRYRRAG